MLLQIITEIPVQMYLWLCCLFIYFSLLYFFRKTVQMKRSFRPWSMSVLAMALNLNSSSWRRLTWTGKPLTLSSSSSRRNFHSRAMSQCPSWTTPNLLCGVHCAETTSLGILRSFSLDPMERHSNATAGDTWPATLKETLRNFSA